MKMKLVKVKRKADAELTPNFYLELIKNNVADIIRNAKQVEAAVNEKGLATDKNWLFKICYNLYANADIVSEAASKLKKIH